MATLVRVLLAGWLISMLGSLPLGTLNLTSLQIALQEGAVPAIIFAVGVLLVELIYVRVTLAGIEWLRHRTKWQRWFEWLTFLLLCCFALSNFFAVYAVNGSTNTILSPTIPRFWLGATLSAVNPLQIPFWLGWSGLLFSRGILQANANHYIFYLVGIGVGTFLGHGLFIYGGHAMAARFANREKDMQYVIAILFSATALYQLWRAIRSQMKSGQI